MTVTKCMTLQSEYHLLRSLLQCGPAGMSQASGIPNIRAHFLSGHDTFGLRLRE